MIELGTLLAGPFAGRLLGDMGAEVIKVEAPGKPDPLRDWGHARYEGRSLWWPVQSRNKKCITLNLREPRGQELMLELVRVADVLSENFRPGTLERWNLGYEQLSAANPGIVLARISGYGQTGPYAERAGYASVAEAIPRGGAAARRDLARRLARRDVRRAGHPRGALPPRRAR
jgi:crotonobetainyl-CoA:carnitine CoA-transferase CaiB-like acyl-CoA transferase